VRIAITGGTGSLGNALVDRLLTLDAERIVVISRSEHLQAQMAERLGNPPNVRFFLGDVRDRDRLVKAFYGCDAVIHSAALKRIDRVAYDPAEVIKTNVLGTANTIDAAMQAGVSKVVFLSSDKASSPANAYGSSKQLAEFYAVAANSYTYPQGLRVCATRYGNVFSSRGSVVHIFRAARNAGRPIPVTHPDCTRFWLTLNDAVDIVLNALELMRGGEIFVPWLPAFQVTNLAEVIAPGVEQEVVGLRPGGEKLHEQLLSEEEESRTLAVTEVLPWRGMELLYVMPSHRSWSDEPWKGEPWAASVPYRSDVHPWRLNQTELRELVEKERE
jgi:UDP-N-acetylglucosamine 4,6-dehydratase/5-epimerase